MKSITSTDVKFAVVIVGIMVITALVIRDNAAKADKLENAFNHFQWQLVRPSARTNVSLEELTGITVNSTGIWLMYKDNMAYTKHCAQDGVYLDTILEHVKRTSAEIHISP